ncbi:hypothetical protein G6F56_003192 [Rhizopus delemar]|nr:hypothetical protein G6F56_003192 [Rhizopus delemar]
MDPTFRKLLAHQHHTKRVQNSFSTSTTTIPSTNPNHPIFFRPNSTSRPNNSGSLIQKCNRSSSASFPRLLQLNFCNTEEGQRLPTCLQSEASQSVPRSPAFQNGNFKRGFIINTTKQLSDLYRFIRRFSPHSCSPRVSEIPSISLEGCYLPIPDNTLRFILSALAFHKNLPTDPTMGPSARDTNQCIYRRLGHCSRQLGNLPLSHVSSPTETNDTWMEDQPLQINSDTESTIRSSRLQIEYGHHDSSATPTEDSRYSTLHQSGTEKPLANASSDSQSDNADTGGHFCPSSGTPIHQTASLFQESLCEASTRLGHSDLATRTLQGRAALVVQQPTQVEWTFNSSNDTNRNHLCRRERFGLGMPLQKTKDSWVLDSPGIPDVDQLEGIEGGFSGPTILSSLTPQNDFTQNRQHYITQSYQQVWGVSGTSSQHTGNRALDLVSTERYHNSGAAYTRKRKRSCRSGVQTHVHQKSLADTSQTVSYTSTETRPTLCRFVCGQDDIPVTKIRLVEARSGGDCSGCVQFELESVPSTLGEPALESNHTHSTQDSPGSSNLDNNGSPALDQCALVSSPSAPCDIQTTPSLCQSYQVLQSTDPLPLKERLETVRLAALRSKFVDTALSVSAQQLLTKRLTEDSPTTRAYKHAQLAFVEWAEEHSVSLTDFQATDLVNFLSDIKFRRNLHHNTLKTWRSGVLRFHRNQTNMANDPVIQAFFTALCAAAEPIPIHRPTVDLTPTFTFLKRLDSVTCSFRRLQQKTAFLLAMATFLRPSDLSRIDLTSMDIDPADSTLTFNIVAPKEKRKGQRIIKPVLVHPHTDPHLCPVVACTTLRDHPFARDKRPPSVLFVNSHSPAVAVRTTTISSWLRQLIRLSTSETRVSVRSLASSLALRVGISREDIQTLGNWQSSLTFDTFYRREHMTTVDFTNRLISTSTGSFPVTESLPDTDSEDEEFFDAKDA